MPIPDLHWWRVCGFGAGSKGDVRQEIEVLVESHVVRACSADVVRATTTGGRSELDSMLAGTIISSD